MTSYPYMVLIKIDFDLQKSPKKMKNALPFRIPPFLNKFSDIDFKILEKAVLNVVNYFSYIILEDTTQFYRFIYKKTEHVERLRYLNDQKELEIKHCSLPFDHFKSNKTLTSEIENANKNGEILITIVIEDKNFILALPKSVLKPKFKEANYYKYSNQCATCGEFCTLNCNYCLKVRYCNAECQKKDWPNHKSFCKQNPKFL
jgi:hypothetical protein